MHSERKASLLFLAVCSCHPPSHPNSPHPPLSHTPAAPRPPQCGERPRWGPAAARRARPHTGLAGPSHRAWACPGPPAAPAGGGTTRIRRGFLMDGWRCDGFRGIGASMGRTGAGVCVQITRTPNPRSTHPFSDGRRTAGERAYGVRTWKEVELSRNLSKAFSIGCSALRSSCSRRWRHGCGGGG